MRVLKEVERLRAPGAPPAASFLPAPAAGSSEPPQPPAAYPPQPSSQPSGGGAPAAYPPQPSSQPSGGGAPAAYPPPISSQPSGGGAPAGYPPQPSSQPSAGLPPGYPPPVSSQPPGGPPAVYLPPPPPGSQPYGGAPPGYPPPHTQHSGGYAPPPGYGAPPPHGAMQLAVAEEHVELERYCGCLSILCCLIFWFREWMDCFPLKASWVAQSWAAAALPLRSHRVGLPAELLAEACPSHPARPPPLLQRASRAAPWTSGPCGWSRCRAGAAPTATATRAATASAPSAARRSGSAGTKRSFDSAYPAAPRAVHTGVSGCLLALSSRQAFPACGCCWNAAQGTLPTPRLRQLPDVPFFHQHQKA